MKLLLRTEKQEGVVPVGAPGASLGRTLKVRLVHPRVPFPTYRYRSLLSLLRAPYSGWAATQRAVPDAISRSLFEMQLSGFPLCRKAGCKIA